ncbi:MAG: sigma-70 family RNA polymerase sigma factor [Clostridia bacterium]|nr:sigma-70 family RNA polymerase sigma factor [Clostridia bacterium]
MANIVDFIEENYDALLAFSVRLNGNWTDGEDVLQTVAAKLCQKQAELADVTFAKTYLMVCIRNATLNLKRARAKQSEANGRFRKTKEAMEDPTAEEAFRYVEWAESLDRHLARYDEPLRRAFIAYYVDQKTLGEVAGSLGMTNRQVTRKFADMRAYLKRNHKRLFTQLSILLSM